VVATTVGVAAVASGGMLTSNTGGGHGHGHHGHGHGGDLTWTGTQQDNSAGTTWGQQGWGDDGLGRPDAAPEKIDIGTTVDSDGVIRGTYAVGDGHSISAVPGEPGPSILAGSGPSGVDEGRGTTPPPPPPAPMTTMAPQPAASTGVGASSVPGGSGAGGGGYHNPGTVGSGGSYAGGTVGGAGGTGYNTGLAAAGGGGPQVGAPGSGLAGGHGMSGGSGTALTGGGFGTDSGPRPSDDSSWKNEGRMRWHDDDEDAPPAD
jgi:hypothetical protein